MISHTDDGECRPILTAMLAARAPDMLSKPEWCVAVQVFNGRRGFEISNGDSESGGSGSRDNEVSLIGVVGEQAGPSASVFVLGPVLLFSPDTSCLEAKFCHSLYSRTEPCTLLSYLIFFKENYSKLHLTLVIRKIFFTGG